MEAQTNQGSTTTTAPVTPVQPEPSKEPQKAAPVVSPATPEAPKARVLGDDEEPSPEDKDLTLSAEAFRKRLERGNKKYLRETFGTDDPKTLKERLFKLEEMEKKEEETRRAALDEQTRLKEDLQKERDARTQAEQRAQEFEEYWMADQADNRIKNLVTGLIDPDPDTFEFLSHKFCKHLVKTYSEKEMNNLTDKDIRGWFEEYVKEHPKYAPDAPKKEAAPAPAHPVVPLTTGKSSKEKPQPLPPGANEQKTARPNQANSMTKEEIRRKYGYSW